MKAEVQKLIAEMSEALPDNYQERIAVMMGKWKSEISQLIGAPESGQENNESETSNLNI